MEEKIEWHEMRGEYLVCNCQDLSQEEKETLVDMLMEEQDGKSKK